MCLQNGACGVEPDAKIVKAGFRFFRSFRSIVDQNTLEDLRKEQEMCSRMLQWKQMSFKVLKVTMPPRYIWTTRNRSAVARMPETNYLE